MMYKLLFIASLMLTSCGYHLVGHGTATVIPEGVITATLEANQNGVDRNLLAELKYQWQQKDNLPTLADEGMGEEHITLRIEKVKVSFTPAAFDASGLAIQYRLSIGGMLSMYQQDTLIWGSGEILESADIFEGSDPSVTEAERNKWTEQLTQEWAKDALSRLRSGF